MTIDKSRLRKLEAALARRPGIVPDFTIPERLQALIACPEAIEWELNFDYHHLCDDEPGGQLDNGIEPSRRIDFTGMNEEQRGEAICKAYEAWLVDHPHPLAEKGN